MKSAQQAVDRWKAAAPAAGQSWLTGVQNTSVDVQAMPGIVNSLPARGPAGSAANEARVIALTRALHARKGDFKG
jgi:hypothetical protein